MKIFITGGTGFVGSSLMTKLGDLGHEISVLTRVNRPDRSQPAGVTFIEGDPTKAGKWQEKVSEYDVVINLAGASIFSRWTQKRKKLIRDSRILTTQNLVAALSSRRGKDTLLISTSAIGYYGFHGDEDLDENSLPGNDFLGLLSQEWESEALKAEAFGIRVLLCRFGIVLGSKGGALEKMALPIRWYLGSPLGNGNQWLSWIHEQDLAEIFLFLIQHKDLSGPVNCTAPIPVTNREMTRALALALHRPIVLPPVPAFFMRLLLGEFGSMLVNGQKVIPQKLLGKGFRFQFSRINVALDDLSKKSGSG